MIIHLLFLLLFGIVPMILPLSLLTLFSFLKLTHVMDTQYEYSEKILLTNLDELTEKTIRVQPVKQTEGLRISSSAWIFYINEQKPKLAAPLKRLKRKMIAKNRPGFLARNDLDIQKKIEQKDDDPFLKEWQEKKKGEYSVLSIQKGINKPSKKEVSVIPRTEATRGEGSRDLFRDSSRVALGMTPVEDQPKSELPSESQEGVLLNMDLTGGEYLSYTTLDGSISVEGDSWVESFYEVFFYDRIGEQGMDDQDSTVIASQEIRDPSKQFMLRIPAESSGIIVAKGYALDDPEKKNPIYLGTYEKKPLKVPKEGISNLNIALFPRDKYFSKYLTTFVGKIYNEYEGKNVIQCVPGAAVSLLELNQQTTTDEQCVFEFKGMAIGYPYHLLFEKEGFATVQIPVKLEQKKEFRTFLMSPMTKFTQGYDSLLGERNRDKSVLFATVYKRGKPLERAIVKAPQSEKIVYERTSDLGSFPDETLFSASSNGKVILWNVDPGKISIDVFYDGHYLGRRMARLMPGITHQLEIDF